MIRDPQDAISDEEFDTMLETELEGIKKAFKPPTKEFMPHMMVALRGDFNGDIEMTMVAFADFPDTDQRFMLMQALGIEFWKKRRADGIPVAIMFTSEAWFKQIKGKEAEAAFHKSNKQISDYDDKEEGLVTFGLTIDGRRSMASHKLERNKQGKINAARLKLYAPVNDKKDKMGSELLNNFYIGILKEMEKEKKA